MTPVLAATSISSRSRAISARSERCDCHDRNDSGSGLENRLAGGNRGRVSLRFIANAHQTSVVAVAQKPAAASNAHWFRWLSWLLVFLGRGLETAAFLANAWADRGLPGVVQQGPDLRFVDLYSRILHAHLGQHSPHRDRVSARHRRRRAACFVSGLVGTFQTIRLFGF